MATISELEQAKNAAVKAHEHAQINVLGVVMAVVAQRRNPSQYAPLDSLLDQLGVAEDAREAANAAMLAAMSAVVDAYDAAHVGRVA
jgi:hypothetical protein